MTGTATGTIRGMAPEAATNALSALESAVSMLRKRVETEGEAGLVSTDVVLDSFAVDMTPYGGLYELAKRARALLGDLSSTFVGGMRQLVDAAHPEVPYEVERVRDAAELGQDINLKDQRSGGIIETHVALAAVDALAVMIDAEKNKLVPVPG